MNPFGISGWLVGLTSLALGFFVLLKNRSDRLYRSWFLVTLMVAVWGFGGAWIATEQDLRLVTADSAPAELAPALDECAGDSTTTAAVVAESEDRDGEEHPDLEAELKRLAALSPIAGR